MSYFQKDRNRIAKFVNREFMNANLESSKIKALNMSFRDIESLISAIFSKETPFFTVNVKVWELGSVVSMHSSKSDICKSLNGFCAVSSKEAIKWAAVTNIEPSMISGTEFQLCNLVRVIFISSSQQLFNDFVIVKDLSEEFVALEFSSQNELVLLLRQNKDCGLHLYVLKQFGISVNDRLKLLNSWEMDSRLAPVSLAMNHTRNIMLAVSQTSKKLGVYEIGEDKID